MLLFRHYRSMIAECKCAALNVITLLWRFSESSETAHLHIKTAGVVDDEMRITYIDNVIYTVTSDMKSFRIYVH